MEAGELKKGYTAILEHMLITKEEMLKILEHIRVDKLHRADRIYPRI